MICHTPFLVGAGQVPDEQMKNCCNALSQFWGGSLLEVSVSQNPNIVLQSLTKQNGLVQLLGDPAKTLSNNGNWLEALGAWRYPTVLIANSSDSGVSGSVLAYTTLCRKLLIPLLGIVQYGGEWDFKLRRLDGLPWCGWLPEKEKNNNKESIKYGIHFENQYEIVRKLKRRLNNI